MIRVAVLLLSVVLICSFLLATSLKDVSELEMVAKLTGPNAINNTLKYDVFGTDLGHSFNDGEITFFVFGDTFGINNTNWRKNVMAFTTDQDPSDGIIFEGFITGDGGSTYEFSENKIKLNVVKGADLWSSVDLAPKLLKSQLPGGWSIETRIESNSAPVGATNLCGLLFFSGMRSWIMWGHLGNRTMEASGIIGGEFVKIAEVNSLYPYLRIENRLFSNVYVFSYSQDGKNWIEAGTFDDKEGFLNSARYGIGAKEWGTSDYEVIFADITENSVNFAAQELREAFYWGGPEESSGAAKELIHSMPGNITAIPTNGVAVNSKLYIHYMMVNRWGEPGRWNTSYSGLAVSENGGQTWEILDSVKWSSESNFAQVGIAKASQWLKIPDGCDVNSDTLFFFGIPSGRFGGVKLMKVNGEEIEKIGAYEYFSGLDNSGIPQWSGKEEDAAIIIEAPFGECSAMYNHFLGKWIITYLNEHSHDLEIRESANPWGPWSKPYQLVSSREYPGLYGAFLNPLLVENEGEYIYFIMSLWMPYNVYLMKARLVR